MLHVWLQKPTGTLKYCFVTLDIQTRTYAATIYLLLGIYMYPIAHLRAYVYILKI